MTQKLAPVARASYLQFFEILNYLLQVTQSPACVFFRLASRAIIPPLLKGTEGDFLSSRLRSGQVPPAAGKPRSWRPSAKTNALN
ncbi:MAG: hypothetical protein C4520_21765 [Candidatus Abyssobacteria bacterium SURF_5]|uniref:Uncharacterized protein n=1 Tax=Abyssobacteria bacterium (strain SURF_5) TaxID=2093360 RepID=A0A3A4MVV0_ABYX5|nr:MAG: hypothetical protein C4520_21765 [Candidatus Abyssubacteria bacterium SURF_5]